MQELYGKTLRPQKAAEFLMEADRGIFVRTDPPAEEIGEVMSSRLLRSPDRIRRADNIRNTTREGWYFLCGLYWTRTSDPIDVNDVL